MSRGPGVVQHRLIVALHEPSRWFTVLELAEAVYGESVEVKHLSAVRRDLEAVSGLHRTREGQYGVHGYRGFASLSPSTPAPGRKWE
jgi:hypothetical protein